MHLSVNQEIRCIKQTSMLTLTHINNHPRPTPTHNKRLEVEVSEVSLTLRLVLHRVYHRPPLCRLHPVICRAAFQLAINAVAV